MKISQILIQPIGQRFNPGTLSIKTAKKKWQVKDVWWQQVILMDETGEIPADVKIGKLIPLNGSREINVIVAEIQEAEYLGKDRKKLVVDQFSIPTQTADEFQSKQDEIDKEVKLIVRSKIKCWIVSANSPKVEYDHQCHTFNPSPVQVLEWLVDFVKDERLDKVVDGIIGE